MAAGNPAIEHVRRWHEPDESIAFGGVTEELIPAALFVARDDPACITGAELIVDGGETII